MVGEPGGRRRLQPVRGRVPRPGQHRPARPLAPACRAACSSSPTPPAGWRPTRWPWGPSRRSCDAPRQRPADDLVQQVPRALRRDPRRDRDQGSVGRDRRAVLRPAGHRRRRRPCRSRSARWSASSRCWPRASSTRRCSTASQAVGKQFAEFLDRAGLRDREQLAELGLLRGEPGTPAAAARRRRHRPARAAVREAVRPGRVPVPLRAARAVGLPPRAPLRAGRGGLHAAIDYEPAESTTAMFGGNSNWRGPVWFPLNYLVIAALERYHRFFGDDYTVEYPTGSGQTADARRDRRRPVGPAGLDLPGRPRRAAAVLRRRRAPADTTRAGRTTSSFNEYFHGDNGAGLGASHQTGWTGLVADIIRRRHGDGDLASATLLRALARRRRDVTDVTAPAGAAGQPVPARRDAGRRGHELRRRVRTADGVQLCLFDDDGTETRVALPEHDGGVWHGFVPGVGAGPGLRLPGDRTVRPRPRAALQPCQAAARPVRPGDRRARSGSGPRCSATTPTTPTSPARSTRRPTCRAAWSSTRPSTGRDRRAAPRATPTRSSTRCTSRGSPRRTRTCPPELRGTYAGLGARGGGRPPRRPRRHHGRAAAGAPQRARVVPRRAGTDQLLGLQHHRLLRAARRLLGGGAGRAARGARSPSSRRWSTRCTRAGLEVVLDVVFNHTAEGDHVGPTLCHRGLDNAAYYRLDPDRPAAATSTRPAAATRSTRPTRSPCR